MFLCVKISAAPCVSKWTSSLIGVLYGLPALDSCISGFDSVLKFLAYNIFPLLSIVADWFPLLPILLAILINPDLAPVIVLGLLRCLTTVLGAITTVRSDAVGYPGTFASGVDAGKPYDPEAHARSRGLDVFI